MRALRQTPQQQHGIQELTNREREVFDLLVSGLSVKVIAEQLNLSHKTVHVHRANVLGKLQCDSTIELVHYALEHNIISR
ncbi:Transcriptional regulatory protein uhpA [Providencia rustigianii]|nr:Transcriptional regulatory protein uhpA [Providencia rustigianii]